MELYEKYFNKSLRDYLKYPEKFSISISQDKVILTPDQPSQLLKLIYNNNTTKDSVLVSLKNGLKDSNLKDVYLTTNGTNITINFEFKVEPFFRLGPFTIDPSNTIVNRFDTKTVNRYLVDFDINVWAILFSYLDNREFQNLLKSDLKVLNMLKNQTFWIELIRQRFPEYYAPQATGYDWNLLYYDLKMFDDFYQKVLAEEKLVKIDPWHI